MTTFCWLVCLNRCVRSERSQLSKRSHSTSCLIHTKPLFKQDNNIPQISFRSIMRKPFRIRNEGGSRTYDTRGPLKKTQEAEQQHKEPCLSVPRHATMTHSATVCTSSQSHVTGVM